MANVISFNDAVLQRQKSASSNETNIERVIVSLDDKGNKQLVNEESMKKTLSDIKNIMSSIAKTMELNLAATLKNQPTNAGAKLNEGTQLSENESEAAKAEADADKENHVLLNKLIEGISGLKKATDDGLTKLGQTFKEGSGGGGGILGGLSSLLGAGKDLVGGGVKGVGGKIAGIARGGLNMISKAGPLAGVAGLGLAGFNVVNDVMGNIDKSNEVEANVKSGALTRDQGNVLQGESFGSTAGTAAGAAIGGIAGSALGPLGTAAGMWLGSKVGGFAGGVAGKYGVKAYQGIKGLFGFGESKQEVAAKMSPEQQMMQQYASGEIDVKEYNKKMKLQTEGGSAAPVPTPVSASATKGDEYYYDSNGVKLKKQASVSSKDLMTPASATVPAEVQAAVSADASLSPGEQIVPPSNIVATPTQEPKSGGMWDSMKSMGATALGGIKSGANWVGDKASSIGKGISNWFGGTRLGQDLAKRNVGVGYNGVGVAGGEEKVGSNTNLNETSDASGTSSTLNQGVTVEKSALGSSWLGRLIAGKGTQTESFVAQSSTSGSNADGSDKAFNSAETLGSRKSGGWFGKDEYTLTDPATGEPVKVDKSTYMQAKGIAAKGGDASAIGGLIAKDQSAKQAASMAPATTAMGDQVYGASAETMNARDDLANKKEGGGAIVNAPTTVNNTTQQASVIRSPVRNEESSLNRYYGTRMGVY
jgi:hypothetical protein